VTLQTAMQRTATEVGDGVLKAAKHVVQRQQCLLSERHDDGFLGERQHRALRRFRSHRRISRRDLLAPLGHRLGVQAVADGKGPGAFFDAWSSARTHGVVRALP